jgi:hypothetical protein
MSEKRSTKQNRSDIDGEADEGRDTKSKSAESLFGKIKKYTQAIKEAAKQVKDAYRRGDWFTIFATSLALGWLALPFLSGRLLGSEKWNLYLFLSWFLLGVLFFLVVIILAPDTPTKALVTKVPLLEPFRTEQEQLYRELGRDFQVQTFCKTIVGEDFKFGVLQAESGCGKTSFLRAGLQPNLRTSGWPALYLRVGPGDMQSQLREALMLAAKEDPDVWLTENRVEAFGLNFPASRVLLFDQFEEFFTHNPKLEDRKCFVEEMSAWFNGESSRSIRVVFALREDFVGRLQEFQMAMRYRLGPMANVRLEKFNPDLAANVIKALSAEFGMTVTADSAAKVAQDLAASADGRVLPADIQIILWMWSTEREAQVDARARYRESGGVEGLLGVYLQRVISCLHTEQEHQLLIQCLLALVDERNRLVRAGLLSPEEIGKRLPRKWRSEKKAIIDMMTFLAGQNVRLVVTDDSGFKGRRYELAHERLIPAILRAANVVLGRAVRVQRIIDAKFHYWQANGRHWYDYLSLGQALVSRWQWDHIPWESPAMLRQTFVRQSLHFRVGTWLSALALLSCAVGASFWWLESPMGQIFQIRREMAFWVQRTNNPETLLTAAMVYARNGEMERSQNALRELEEPIVISGDTGDYYIGTSNYERIMAPVLSLSRPENSTGFRSVLEQYLRRTGMTNDAIAKIVGFSSYDRRLQAWSSSIKSCFDRISKGEPMSSANLLVEIGTFRKLELAENRDRLLAAARDVNQYRDSLPKPASGKYDRTLYDAWSLDVDGYITELLANKPPSFLNALPKAETEDSLSFAIDALVRSGTDPVLVSYADEGLDVDRSDTPSTVSAEQKKLQYLTRTVGHPAYWSQIAGILHADPSWQTELDNQYKAKRAQLDNAIANPPSKIAFFGDRDEITPLIGDLAKIALLRKDKAGWLLVCKNAEGLAKQFIFEEFEYRNLLAETGLALARITGDIDLLRDVATFIGKITAGYEREVLWARAAMDAGMLNEWHLAREIAQGMQGSPQRPRTAYPAAIVYALWANRLATPAQREADQKRVWSFFRSVMENQLDPS